MPSLLSPTRAIADIIIADVLPMTTQAGGGGSPSGGGGGSGGGGSGGGSGGNGDDDPELQDTVSPGARS